MLSIYFGKFCVDKENYIWDMNSYFDFEYEQEQLDDNISREIIRDIDKSEVIMGKVIDSPILGLISPDNLSGGAKLLITMNIEGNKNIYNGTKCGPNCSDWILRISELKDIIISREYPIEFTKEPFRVKILNDNSIVTNNDELLDKYIEYIDEGLNQYER